MVREWNNDTCVDDIHEIVQNEGNDDNDCIVNDSVKEIAASEAIEIFKKDLPWAGDATVDQSDMSMLRRKKAVFPLLEKKKRQKNITDFFNS